MQPGIVTLGEVAARLPCWPWPATAARAAAGCATGRLLAELGAGLPPRGAPNASPADGLCRTPPARRLAYVYGSDERSG